MGRDPRAGGAALFVAITLLPYLLVSNLFVPVGAIMAERFLYLPEVGVSLLAALLMQKIGKPARVVFMIVVAILAVAMFARARDWKDDATIFAATARNNPQSPRAWLWLGEARPRHRRAVRSSPRGGTTRAWRSRDRATFAGAERALREAVRLDPTRTAPHLNLGIVLHRRRRASTPPSARVRKAALLDPTNPRAFAELGHLRSELGDRPGAADAYRRAIALGRTDLLPRLRELE